MSSLPGKFVWFEHLSADIPKARRFYDALFGWHTESMPMGGQRYSMILNGDGTTSEGIGGYRNIDPGARPSWISYISVDDVDARYAAALAAGATGLSAPADHGTVGRGATITDPTGAAVCLWKSADGDRADPAKTPIGAWCWNELWTTDDARALAFYEKVIGYTHDSMDMGPEGTYYIISNYGDANSVVRSENRRSCRSISTLNDSGRSAVLTRRQRERGARYAPLLR